MTSGKLDSRVKFNDFSDPTTLDGPTTFWIAEYGTDWWARICFDMSSHFDHIFNFIWTMILPRDVIAPALQF